MQRLHSATAMPKEWGLCQGSDNLLPLQYGRGRKMRSEKQRLIIHAKRLPKRYHMHCNVQLQNKKLQLYK